MISGQKSMIFGVFHGISQLLQLLLAAATAAYAAEPVAGQGRGNKDPCTPHGGAPVYKAARGSTPPSFSSQAPLIPSHRVRAARDAAET